MASPQPRRKQQTSSPAMGVRQQSRDRYRYSDDEEVDLEAGGGRLGIGREEAEREALLPTHTRSSRAVKGGTGRKRRDSNTFNASSRSPIHIDRRTTALCLFTTALFALTCFGLYLYGSSLGNGGGPEGTNPSKDQPHVVPPFKLPPPTNLPRNEAHLVRAERGAVASEDIDCSKMGTRILEQGGNAVDAAITTTLCIGTLNAFSSGIGGGGFVVVRVPDEKGFSEKNKHKNTSLSHEVVAIDFRETSPAASHKDLYVAIPGSSQVGGLAVGVPGELRGLQMLHEKYGSGRLTWKELVQPNVELARNGWRVSRELARRFRIFGGFMADKPEWAAVYRPRGDMLVEGDWMNRMNYSKTLEAIGEEGADIFYHDSWISKAILETIKREGGIMTADDLADYQPLTYPALSTSFRGRNIFTTDAPTCGPVMLMMFNALDTYRDLDWNTLTIHRFVEALKFAFARRTEIADPAYGGSERMREFATKEFGKQISHNITDETTHTASYYSPIFDVPIDSGTTHLSIVDQWGGAVSLTTTVNLIFGSRVMDPVTGVILNDEQDDFSTPGKINAFGLPPSPFNYPAPGKRPLSSTAATIVENEDGSFYAALGGSGGSRIFGAVAQVYLNLLFGKNVSAAIEEPRVHDQLYPATITAETAYDETLLAGLRARGHNISMFDINLGVAEVQAVVRESNGTIWAASDSRKNGIAWGY